MTNIFAQLSRNLDQRPNVTTPVKIELNQDDAIKGIVHSQIEPADIQITESGTYVVIVAPQVGRTSGTTERYVDVWLRLNDVDIPNSNVRSVLLNSKHKDVLVCQTMLPFNVGDKLNVMMSVEVPNEGLGIEAIHPKNEPTIPSIIFSMHKIAEPKLLQHVVTGRGTSRSTIER
jgi:hypothetical protein